MLPSRAKIYTTQINKDHQVIKNIKWTNLIVYKSRTNQ